MGHDADSLLLAIMSLQDVTPYYWGQNRLGNLIPFLASWIDVIDVNFKFQVFLRAMGASTIPLVVFILMDVKKEVLLKYLLSTALFFFVFKDYLIMTLWTYGHPYGTASAILLISLFLDKRNSYSLNYKSMALTSLIFFFLFLMFFVNLSFIILIAPIFLGLMLVSYDKEKLIFLIMLTVAWLTARYHATFYGGSEGYSEISIKHFFENVYQAFFTSNAISLYSNTSYFLLLILVVGFLLSLVYIQKKSNNIATSYIVSPFVLKNIIIFSSIVLYILIVANIKWIEMNAYAGRYFIIAFMFLLSLMSITFIDLCIKSSNVVFIRLLISGVFIASLYNSVLPVNFECKFSDNSRSQQVNAITNMGVRHDVSVILGGYWESWPSVYELINRKQMLKASNPKQVYGFVTRGETIKNQISHFIENSESIQVLCIDMSASQCFQKTKNYFIGDWPRHTYLLEENILPGGENAIVMGFYKYKRDAEEINLKLMGMALNNPKVEYELMQPYSDKTKLVKLKVINKGSETWLAEFSGKFGLALSYKVENVSKGKKTGYDNRFYLPRNIDAGDSFEISIPLNNLSEGKNVVTVSMVQELVAWFHDKGSEPLIIRVEI